MMAQAETQSDPISGSLGFEKGMGINNTENADIKFERYLNKLKPVTFHNDENINTTWSSLTWAE